MSDKFDRIAINPLDSVMVGATKRYQYADDNIKSMTNNNPNNVFKQLINDTQSKLDAYKGKISESKLSEALRIAYTSELTLSMDEIVVNAGKCEGLVKSAVGKNTPVYLEFYPFGLSEFHEANPTQLLDLLDRMISSVATHAQELGSNVYSDKFNDNKVRLKKAISNQKNSGSKVINSKEVKEILWNELKKQLYKNMLTIALYYIDNLNMVHTYFNPTLLRHHHHNNDDDTTQTYKLLIPALSSKTAEISFAVNDTLLIINNGIKSIFYYGAATAEGEQSKPTPIEIPAGEEAEVTAISLGAPANKFIIFVNKDATEEGEVEIALI